MPKATLEEKRLENLRRQLAGRAAHPKEATEKSSGTKTFSFSSGSSYSINTTDTTYLRGDLTKIFVLSSLAIAAELSLYFFSLSHSLNLGSLHF